MDASTLAHLDKYLSSYCDREYADRLKTAMLAEYAGDPEYWQDRGWRALREQVEPLPRVPVCSICGEQGNTVPYSMAGEHHVHGPTSHPFSPA